jgi:uncharacterized protein YabN with tetrapyrrole methylase and pyrophosphatase domain
MADLDDELRELQEEPSADELGDVLFAAVNVARKLDVDPELALRRAASASVARSRLPRRSRRRRRELERAAARAQDAYFDQAKERRDDAISDVHARQVLDSRGNPTVEVE